MFWSTIRTHHIRSHPASPAYTDGDSPLPDPDSWFCMGPSSAVRTGGVITRKLTGQDVVLYRTRSGLLHAIRPYCPHLGAHLGRGGTVEGEDLVCPFHKFAYGPDGACTRTTYDGKTPKISLTVLPVREATGLIWVWYHRDGAPPTWEIPDLPYDGYTAPVCSVTELAGHPQEIGENVFDTGHVATLHGGIAAAASAPFPPTEDGPSCRTVLRLTIRVPGLGTVRTEDYKIVLHGLGDIMAEARMPLGITFRFWGNPTPVAPWRIHLWLAVSVRVPWPWFVPRPLRGPAARLIARLALSFHASQFTYPEQGGDVPIWSTKRYLPRPRLAEGDGPVMHYRRWATQFYPQAPGQEVRESAAEQGPLDSGEAAS